MEKVINRWNLILKMLDSWAQSNVKHSILFIVFLNFLGPFNQKYMFTKKIFCCVFLSIAMMPFPKAKYSFHTCVSSNRSMCTHCTVAASMRASSRNSSFMKKMSYIELISGKYWLSYADWLGEGVSFLLARMWISCSQEAINFIWQYA